MSGSVKTFMKRTLTHHAGQGYIRAIKLTERNLAAGALDFASEHTKAEAVVPVRGPKLKKYDPRLRVLTGKGWRVARPDQYLCRRPATSEQLEYTSIKYVYFVMSEREFEAQYKQVKLWAVNRNHVPIVSPEPSL